MTEHKPGRGRTTRPSPYLLYPDWPNDDTATGAHALVQQFVANLAEFVQEQAAQGVSQAELARRAGIGKATVTKVLHGNVWPDSVTVARLEQLAGRRLWNGPITGSSLDPITDQQTPTMNE